MAWPSNCIAVYSFEQNGNDLTGNGHNGTVYGSPYSNSYSKLGSYSITNPSGSNYVVLPSSLIDAMKNLSSFSLVVWVYLPSGLSDPHFVFARKQDSGLGFCFVLILPPHPYSSWWNFQIRSNWEIPTLSISYNSNQENQWHRFNIEWTGTQYKVYMDGVLKFTKNDSNNSFADWTSNDLLFFLKSNMLFGISGLYIDKVIFYSGILSGADVEETTISEKITPVKIEKIYLRENKAPNILNVIKTQNITGHFFRIKAVVKNGNNKNAFIKKVSLQAFKNLEAKEISNISYQLEAENKYGKIITSQTDITLSNIKDKLL